MNSSWLEVSLLPENADLDALVLTLNRQGIAHKLVKVDNGTSLWVTDAANVNIALNIIRLIEGMTTVNRQEPGETQAAEFNARTGLTRLPLTIAMVVLGIFGTLLVKFLPDFIPLFTFQSFTLIGDSGIEFEPVIEALRRGEWWRLATPAFLHFGLFHIVFNGLWVWELGRRIELLTGSLSYLIIVSGLIIGANVGQYLWSGSALFGGLSGVVYGLLGYIWIRNARIPHPALALPSGILLFMLLWLVICLVGAVDLFIKGSVANGAHVSGLVIGMLFGAFAGRRKNPAV
jgi:GlpG protein